MQTGLIKDSWFTGDWGYIVEHLHHMFCPTGDVGTFKRSTSNTLPFFYGLISVISIFLGLTCSHTGLSGSDSEVSLLLRLMSHFGCWLTHLAKRCSESRNHNETNLITAIKKRRENTGGFNVWTSKMLTQWEYIYTWRPLMVALSVPTQCTA